MQYEIVGKGGPARIAILTPRIQKDEVIKHYMPHLSELGEEIMICNLHISRKRKNTPVSEIKEYLDELLPNLIDSGIEMLVVTNPNYFKVLTKETKTDANIGNIFDAVGGLKATYCPNYQRVFYDPEKITDRIEIALNTVVRWYQGDSSRLGSDIIHKAYYPQTDEEKMEWLDILLDMDVDLSCDTETFSLKHYDAGIGTITFCWNEHHGVAFEVDNCQTKEKNPVVREALKNFFIKFQRKIVYHNISFDGYVLIYQLFMDNILDQEGLLYGMEVILKNWDCSQVITYLATNSCAGNELGLKVQAQEFAGNYAVEEIEDITKIPLPQLLEYNLIDGLSTWYVYNKNKPIMIQDEQEEVYQTLFKDAVVDVIQMQLTGLPIDMDRVKALDKQLNQESNDLVEQMLSTKIVQGFMYDVEEEALAKKNTKLKTKVVTREDLGKTKDLTITFNPNSPNQLQVLLYDENYLGLPILDRTDTGLPSTGADTIEKLLLQDINDEIKSFLWILLEYKASAIIISTFLPAFLKAEKGPDGWHYLFGNFRVGGTLSGRLSSNNPNLQNIPSGSGSKLKQRLAFLVKECFRAPPGWIFCGLDFDSLEDKISALTTKDPNKLKVYTDGYDGHSLRAYFYYADQLSHIEDTVESINSIKDLHPDLRQESKAPTFALTYQGTFMTLMTNCGFIKEKAQGIESAFKDMYRVSIEWVDKKLEQATKDGYVTLAFGLRLRTPILAQTLLKTNKTPKEAAAESRTAGNALGQSYCMLNSRAASEFMKKVRSSEYRLDIKPCAQIHDAQYYLIRDEGNYDPFIYFNTELPKSVRWQEAPEIQHEQVKITGSVEIFHPSWNHGFGIPNGASEQETKERIHKHIDNMKEKGII